MRSLVKQLLRNREIRRHTAAPADRLNPPTRPDPNGWFCVAFSDEVRPGAITTRPFMGGEVVVYRTPRGLLRAVRPRCPHLGAHLGVGGTLDGEEIVCPFHRFAFDPSGACVRTGYDLPPLKATLTQFPVCEANGSIYVWRHALGLAPQWQAPLSVVGSLNLVPLFSGCAGRSRSTLRLRRGGRIEWPQQTQRKARLHEWGRRDIRVVAEDIQ